MSLQARLSILSVGLVVVLLLLGGAFQYFVLGEYLRRDAATVLDRRFGQVVNQDLQVIKGTRCAAGQPAVDAGRVSPPVARCIVNALSGSNVTAVLVNTDGSVNAASSNAGDYPSLPVADYQQGATGTTRAYYTVGTGDVQQLVVLHPLPRRNGQVLGVVQLSQSAEPLQTTQRRLLLVLGIAIAVLTVVAAVVNPLIIRRALGPLRRVTEASAAVAEGNFARRVEEPGSEDELGHLARAFNSMAAAVQRAFAARAESEAGVRNFVGDASHELRTPLTTMQGQLDVLRRGAAEDPAARDQSLQAMQREVGRMSLLVEDLLTLTRLDNPGARVPVRRPVDIDDLLEETIEEQVTRSRGQSVQVERRNRGEALVDGDPEQLRRVLVNLAGNAVAHAPGGTHSWRTGLEGDEVVLSLSDEGGGVAPGEETRIFDRFHRGAGGPAAGGSGLGLAIVRSIVEAHGGSVTAANTGPGLRLTVRLPRAGTATRGAAPGS
ncbi:MAG: two-component system, OmpR family, sensor kinase [Chloroflexota bacterium]|nr:two-component system, OmpR family, sensor kinase [Chloroflexota bacterium]